jgi:hypothetical protein
MNKAMELHIERMQTDPTYKAKCDSHRTEVEEIHKEESIKKVPYRTLSMGDKFMHQGTEYERINSRYCKDTCMRESFEIDPEELVEPEPHRRDPRV